MQSDEILPTMRVAPVVLLSACREYGSRWRLIVLAENLYEKQGNSLTRTDGTSRVSEIDVDGGQANANAIGSLLPLVDLQ